MARKSNGQARIMPKRFGTPKFAIGQNDLVYLGICVFGRQEITLIST